MKSVFLMSRIQVHDPVAMAEYVAKVDPMLAKHGARHVMHSDAVEALDGNYGGGRLVIMFFPNEEKFWAFWNSEEYQEQRAVRRSISSGDVWFVPGELMTQQLV